MIEIEDGYFDAIEKSDASIVPLGYPTRESLSLRAVKDEDG